jgi:mono/diheme cytochrome c family protein
MRWIKGIAIALGVITLLLVGSIFYMKSAAAARFDKTYDVKVESIPIPFPLSRAEIDDIKRRAAKKALAAGGTEAATGEAETAQPAVIEANSADPAAPADGTAEPTPSKLDFAAIAQQRAVQRGKHYVESRAGCSACHGDDFGGKIVFDNMAMGKWSAPNITRGGVVKKYKSEDWLRLIRHGIKPDRKPAMMPSEDYAWFSDQEVSDIAAYIRSLPPVERVMPPSELGPVLSFLIVKGDFRISAEVIDHATPRPRVPPSTAKATEELGKHLATVCTGCHGAGLSGGPIVGGDPDWPPARNLTFHETGLKTWSLADFVKSMREGVRPDGTKIDPSMPVAYTRNMKDTELESLYVYLKALPPKPAGNH